MTRSKWKGPYCNIKFNQNQITTIKSRASTILPEFVGHKFKIHNGKELVLIEVKSEMINHKFGEFAHTKKRKGK